MTKRIYSEAIADRKERLDYFSEPITCPECGATSDKLKPGHQMYGGPGHWYVHNAGTEVCHRWRVEHRVSFAARVCEVFIKLRVDYPLGLVKQYREYIDASETTQVGYLKAAQSILTMASVEGRKDL